MHTLWYSTNNSLSVDWGFPLKRQRLSLRRKLSSRVDESAFLELLCLDMQGGFAGHAPLPSWTGHYVGGESK